ncbi:MAG TPA: hypothetical protein VGY56_21765, partial [Verrucomicrobiae bacterium]|nr:hypothetical protein [Verrucomicrobiae bacterium]
TSIEIKIPAAITALPLAIGEKVVLAHIAKCPGCSNARLAELIGGTCRGVENLLRRLRQRGYIEQFGKGRARWHQLLFSVEHHILCGDDEVAVSVVKSHNSGGDQPGGVVSVQPQGDVPALKRELSWEEDLDQTLAMIHELCVYQDPFPETIINLYGRALKRLVDEAPECPAKDAMVRELTVRRDAFVAISFAQHLPKKYHRQAAQLIHNAAPEVLAQFRQRVEAGQLDHHAPLMLTALADDIDVEVD